MVGRSVGKSLFRTLVFLKTGPVGGSPAPHIMLNILLQTHSPTREVIKKGLKSPESRTYNVRGRNM